MLGEGLEQQAKKLKSSTIITQSEMDRKHSITGSSEKKLISSSTIMDEQHQNVFSGSQKDHLIMKERPKYNLNTFRGMKSLEGIRTIPQEIQKNNSNSYGQKLAKLKTEEILFKVKTRIDTLLKEIDLSHQGLNRFAKLNKLEDMLSFLSEKVKERLAMRQINADRAEEMRSKEQQLVAQYQIKLETANRKLQQKENIQKNLKNKVKETHTQLRQIYDKLNIKEKELSSRMTELYQNKVYLKESQKIVETLKARCSQLQTEQKTMTRVISQQNIGKQNNVEELNIQIKQLKERIKELEEELTQSGQREYQIREYSKQLDEELIRWRERFESQVQQKVFQLTIQRQRQSLSQKEKDESSSNTNIAEPLFALNELKKSVISMSQSYIDNNNGKSSTILNSSTVKQLQNFKLMSCIKQLQKQNKQLKRDLLNFQSYKSKFNEKVSSVNKEKDLSQGLDQKKMVYLKQKSGDLYKMELEYHYKKISEQVAKEWKDKLYEIVYKYEDEAEKFKEQINDLTHQKQHLQKKIRQLATEKYDSESRLIKRQSMIIERQTDRQKITNEQSKYSEEYNIFGGKQSNKSLKKSFSLQLNEIPLENKEKQLGLKMIQEEESPSRKYKKSQDEAVSSSQQIFAEQI